MELLWGVVIVGLGLLAWGGQVVTWLAPEAAARLSLTEAEDAVDAVYWADLRGEARWDAMTLWTGIGQPEMTTYTIALILLGPLVFRITREYFEKRCNRESSNKTTDLNIE